jgi:hypothetical protein
MYTKERKAKTENWNIMIYHNILIPHTVIQLSAVTRGYRFWGALA